MREHRTSIRALTIAIIVTLALAVTASVFAIWPVVADAPWEDEVVAIPTVDRIREIRCQGALDLREALILAGHTSRSRTYQASELEITRYC